MKLAHSRGFGLIEIVVVSSIIAVVTLGIMGALQLYIKMSNTGGQFAQAALMTEETSEALRIMRDTGWTANIASLALDTTYYFVWNGSQYEATTTPVAIQNSFFRTIRFSAVNRDVNDNVASAGNPDPDTRKVTVTIFPATTSMPAILRTDFLIHNVYDN